MPNVMINRDESGTLTCYIAKKDLEEAIVSIEFDQDDKFGGNFELADGSCWYVDPLDEQPKLPMTMRARRG